jgi:hypothetical protein
MAGSLVGADFALAASTIFDNRVAFESTLANIVLDDYEDPRYQAGDLADVTDFDVHSNVSMNGIFGETSYMPTGWIIASSGTASGLARADTREFQRRRRPGRGVVAADAGDPAGVTYTAGIAQQPLGAFNLSLTSSRTSRSTMIPSTLGVPA